MNQSRLTMQNEKRETRLRCRAAVVIAGCGIVQASGRILRAAKHVERSGERRVAGVGTAWVQVQVDVYRKENEDLCASKAGSCHCLSTLGRSAYCNIASYRSKQTKKSRPRGRGALCQAHVSGRIFCKSGRVVKQQDLPPLSRVGSCVVR